MFLSVWVENFRLLASLIFVRSSRLFRLSKESFLEQKESSVFYLVTFLTRRLPFIASSTLFIRGFQDTSAYLRTEKGTRPVEKPAVELSKVFSCLNRVICRRKTDLLSCLGTKLFIV